MRTWAWNIVRGMEGLPAGMEGRVYSSGSADNPVSPFIIVAMGVEIPVLGMPRNSKTAQVPIDVWCHDRAGSMVNIDNACITLKNNLPSLAPVRIGGLFILEIAWEEIGPDQQDDGFQTMTRRCSFRATTSGRVPVG